METARKLEHTCMPSYDPPGTAAVLARLGGRQLRRNPEETIVFVEFGGGIIELKKVDEEDITLDPGFLHIAVACDSKDEVKTYGDLCDDLGLELDEMKTGAASGDVYYVLYKLPGGIGLQAVWRQTPLL